MGLQWQHIFVRESLGDNVATGLDPCVVYIRNRVDQAIVMYEGSTPTAFECEFCKLSLHQTVLAKPVMITGVRAMTVLRMI